MDDQELEKQFDSQNKYRANQRVLRKMYKQMSASVMKTKNV